MRVPTEDDLAEFAANEAESRQERAHARRYRGPCEDCASAVCRCDDEQGEEEMDTCGSCGEALEDGIDGVCDVCLEAEECDGE